MNRIVLLLYIIIYIIDLLIFFYYSNYYRYLCSNSDYFVVFPVILVLNTIPFFLPIFCKIIFILELRKKLRYFKNTIEIMKNKRNN